MARRLRAGECSRSRDGAGRCESFALPENERAFGVGDGRGGIGGTGGVGEAVVDEALGIVEIGGEKEVEGRAVFDFGGEHGRGLVGGFGRYAGGLLELLEDGRKKGLEVGGGRDAQWSLRGERRGEKGGEGEQQILHLRRHFSGPVTTADPTCFLRQKSNHRSFDSSRHAGTRSG